MYVLQGKIVVRGAIQVKDGDDRVVHCDVDLISACWLVSTLKSETAMHQHSFVSPFLVQPEGLVTSDGKSVVGVSS